MLAIEVNGEIFIDANIQDTVTDTPMRNYAVADPSNIRGTATASNGNLVVETGLSSRIACSNIPMVSGKYYYELDSNDKVQPRISQFGDVDTTSYIEFNNNTAGLKGVVCDCDAGEFTIFYSDSTNEMKQLSSDTGYMVQQSGNGQIATYNFGQQPFAASNVTYDQAAGTVEIDGETYNTLYQTWEQWARTALGYALDRIAKLEQQRASDLATIEDLRTNITTALSRITSIESNEVADDAVDTVLLSTVADLITEWKLWKLDKLRPYGYKQAPATPAGAFYCK